MSWNRLDLIGHSGFALECARCVLVFDLFTDTASVLERVRSLGKPLVFFSSHAHFDHWNPEWLTITGPDTTYILDRSCVAQGPKAVPDPERQRLAVMDPYQELVPAVAFGADAERFLPGVDWVRTFGSTDMGVSFLVHVDGRTVFHAGDLNDWYWEEESTPEELEEAEATFRKELDILNADLLRRETGRIDLAFFPVDARLGRNAARGVMIFTSLLSPARLVPMHMSGDEEIPTRLADAFRDAGLSQTEVLPLARAGQFFTFPES